MFVLVYNITKRLEQNASIEDELAKPPWITAVELKERSFTFG
jgi:hypothetical protein